MKKNIYKSIGFLSMVTFGAKLCGFARTTVVASFFGANAETDAFYLASGLCANLIYAFMTAAAVAFLPLYIEKTERFGHGESARFASGLLCALSVVALGLAALIFAFAPQIAWAIAPSYAAAQLGRVSFYLRILSFGLLFALLSRITVSILDAERRFGYSGFGAIVFSASQILIVVLFAAKLGVTALALSLPAAYVFQFLFLQLRARRYVRLRPEVHCFNGDFKRVAAAALPILLSNSVLEINQLVDRLLASSLEVGSVTALSYAAVLFGFVISIVNGSIDTVSFTEFSESAAKGRRDEAAATYGKGVVLSCMILLPVSVLTMLFATDIVKIVFGRGAFSERAVELTALGLLFYAAGFVFVSVKSISTKLFYAVGNTKLPMKIGILAVGVNIALSILLSRFLGLAGIALGTTIAAACALLLQLLAMKREFGTIVSRAVRISLLKIAAAAAGLLPAALLAGVLLKNAPSVLRFPLASLFGFAVYLGILMLLRCGELKAVSGICVRKYRKIELRR